MQSVHLVFHSLRTNSQKTNTHCVPGQMKVARCLEHNDKMVFKPAVSARAATSAMPNTARSSVAKPTTSTDSAVPPTRAAQDVAFAPPASHPDCLNQ